MPELVQTFSVGRRNTGSRRGELPYVLNYAMNGEAQYGLVYLSKESLANLVRVGMKFLVTEADGDTEVPQ